MTSSVLTADSGSVAGRAARGPIASLLITISALAALTVAIAVHQPPSIAFGAAALTLAFGVTLQTLRMRQAREIEELYRTIVETSHDGICIIDRERRFRYVNPRYAELLGRRPEELLGQLSLPYVHDDDRDAVAQRLALREEGAKINQTELRIVRADGTILHVIAAVTTLYRRGRYDGILCVITDITPRYQAEQALRESEARFRGLYETDVAGICFMRLGDRITEANEKFLRTFGVDAETAMAWESLTAPASHDADLRAIEELRQTGRCAPYEKECIRPDGTHLTVLTCAAMLDPEQELAVCITINVTQRTEARRALERAHEVLAHRVAQLEGATGGATAVRVEELAERLAAANEELQTFTDSVSHDLRAPLRVIDGFTRELQLDAKSTLSDAGKQYVDRIRTSTKRMAGMIDGLLALSRTARLELRRRPDVDLNAIARAAVNELAGPHQRLIDIRIADGLTASADPDLVRIVLENLIGNALKFSSRTTKPCIELDVENGVFFIRDNGAGFDPAYASKLFMPFQRLHSYAEFEGSGIGLATVHRIVQRHGGRIWAESSPGQGATFRFTLGSQ